MNNNEVNAVIVHFKVMLNTQNSRALTDLSRGVNAAMLKAGVPNAPAKWVIDSLLEAIDAGNDELAMHHFRYAVLMSQK